MMEVHILSHGSVNARKSAWMSYVDALTPEATIAASQVFWKLMAILFELEQPMIVCTETTRTKSIAP